MGLLFFVLGGAALIGLGVEAIPFKWRVALGGAFLLAGLLATGLGPE
jgi:hypothetical protein